MSELDSQIERGSLIHFSQQNLYGTGLGLAMSAGLIEKHGGVIEVHSEEGEGNTFTVLLPKPSGALGLVVPNVEIDWPD